MGGGSVVAVAPAGAAVVGGDVVVVVTSPSAPAAPPTLLVCSSGACLICWAAWGAYSAMAGGPVRAAVTVNAATSRRIPAVNAPYTTPGERDRRLVTSARRSTEPRRTGRCPW